MDQCLAVLSTIYDSPLYRVRYEQTEFYSYININLNRYQYLFILVINFDRLIYNASIVASQLPWNKVTVTD